MKLWKLLTALSMSAALFSGNLMDRSSEPHLTPEKLLGGRFAKDTFGDIKVAIIGYCPPPSSLAKYNPKDTSEQYFIHVTPESVKICSIGDTKFLSLYHVYGGAVSSATIEELGYYGIKYILAYGLAGGMGTKGLKIGDAFLIDTAYPKEGVSKFYTDNTNIAADKNLNDLVEELSSYPRVKSGAVDVLYREYDHVIADMADQACDVVNCEASHIFAVANHVGIKATQCGVVTDMVELHEGDDWECDLSVMMSSNSKAASPLEKVNDIIQMYVEKVIPKL